MCQTTPKPLQVYFEYFRALALLLFVTGSGVERAECLSRDLLESQDQILSSGISSVGYFVMYGALQLSDPSTQNTRKRVEAGRLCVLLVEVEVEQRTGRQTSL